MKANGKPIIILMADDDSDDRMLVKDAFDESRLNNDLHFVEDGEQLIDYLYRRRNFAHLKGQPYPGLILLDLNMPKKDGREALAEIKKDPDLRRIPIVIFDDLAGGGRHSADLRSRRELLHHQAGDVRKSGSGGAGSRQLLGRDRRASFDLRAGGRVTRTDNRTDVGRAHPHLAR